MFDLFEKWDGSPRPEGSAQDSSISPSTQTDSSSAYSPLPFSQSFSASKTFVLSVGGSVFFNEKLRAPEIAKFCEVINELKREGYHFVLVVGGGRVARVYQAGVKALGGNNFDMDMIGIALTRANALLFTHSIENVWKEIVLNPREAENILLLGKTPICGASVAGQTSDSVAVLLAEMLGADFINLSNVDGIYSADPVKEPSARMYKELSHSKMVSLLKAQASKPGAHVFIDPHAANLMARSKIKGFFINGNDFENFKSVVRGSPEFKGTLVQTVSSNEAVAQEE